MRQQLNIQSAESHLRDNIQCAAGLENFDDHSLKEVSKLSLMNRFDTKYLLPIHLLPALLQQMKTQYSVLKINDKTLQEYDTKYFDTPNFEFYTKHHNKHLSRSKVRFRVYDGANSAFLEVKLKNNKSKTRKRRVKLQTMQDVETDHGQSFLRSLLDVKTVEKLLHVLTIRYTRMAFMSLEHNERMSIDIGLRGQAFDNGSSFELKDYAIIEVKQSKVNRNSPIFKMLREFSCRSVSFSKYCTSCAILYPQTLRTNRFKRILTFLSPNISINKKRLCA